MTAVRNSCRGCGVHSNRPEHNAGSEAAGTPVSSALEVNLRRTDVDVVIPEDQRVLLECTAHLHGVHEATKHLLRQTTSTASAALACARWWAKSPVACR